MPDAGGEEINNIQSMEVFRDLYPNYSCDISYIVVPLSCRNHGLHGLDTDGTVPLRPAIFWGVMCGAIREIRFFIREIRDPE